MLSNSITCSSTANYGCVVNCTFEMTFSETHKMMHLALGVGAGNKQVADAKRAVLIMDYSTISNKPTKTA